MRPSRPIVAWAGAVAAVLLCAGAHPAAACFEHTFEPCPTQASRDYVVELDRKSGRTWLKRRAAGTGSIERMASLAATAARNLGTRPRSATGPTAARADEPGWETRVSPAAGRAAKN